MTQREVHRERKRYVGTHGSAQSFSFSGVSKKSFMASWMTMKLICLSAAIAAPNLGAFFFFCRRETRQAHGLCRCRTMRIRPYFPHGGIRDPRQPACPWPRTSSGHITPCSEGIYFRYCPAAIYDELCAACVGLLRISCSPQASRCADGRRPPGYGRNSCCMTVSSPLLKRPFSFGISTSPPSL